MALINAAINFGYEYFCFVIYFSTIFLSKLFSNIFFSNIFFHHFFPNIFSQNFFRKFFSQNFFPIFFSQNFFPKFFSYFFSKFFFEDSTLDVSPFTEIKRTLCICVMKNMIYSKRSKLDFSLM